MQKDSANFKLLSLKEKPVLITGCSSGIGLAVARALKQRGYPVYTTARREDDIARLKAEGFPCEYLDYADTESIHTAFEAVMAQTENKLYGLFNNGAYGQPGAVEDLSRLALEEQFQANVFGWHELTCLALPIMRVQREGRIIQNSSVLGLVALKYRGAYNASKFAIEGLTDTLRIELAGTGVYCSLIEPGPIRTKFRENALAKFNEHILMADSPHVQAYKNTKARLENQDEDKEVPFTLPAEAVVPKVVHALESERPKARYPVTFPTYFFGVLKRILPTLWLDKVLSRV